LYQHAIDEMIQNLLNLIFPNNCVLCGNHLVKQENTICISCEVNLPYTQLSNLEDNPVHKLFWGKCAIEHAYSLLYFTKGGKVQQLLHEFKYKKNTKIGEMMGQHIGYELKKLKSRYDLVIPVPLHPKKEKLRGFNQSDFIASGLSSTLKSKFNNSRLKRIHFNESQTRKDRYTRFENTEQIFQCSNEGIFDNQHILIVDDVITTGSTLESCVNTILKENKNVKISLCSIAVAV